MSLPAPYLIVTADDFGLSDGVNAGILAGYRQGIVRNTALLVTYPEAAESAAALRAEPGLDVGIHLNLASGAPRCRTDQVRTIIGKDGNFLGVRSFLARALTGRIDWRDVRREYTAQMEFAHSLGIRFSSISSHRHLHMWPPVTRIAGEMAKAYQIPFVRLSYYHRSSLFRPAWSNVLCVTPVAVLARVVLRRAGVSHNAYALALPPGDTSQAAHEFSSVLRKLPPGIYELICHPGYVDDLLARRDTYLSGRIKELELLTSPGVKALCENGLVKLTTFRALSDS